MSQDLERAQLLFEQSRYNLAEEHLRRALAEEPGHPHAHALLALCLAEAKKFDQATSEAHEAIGLAPDYDFAHYALAHVMVARNRHQEALAAIEEAIRLSPEAPEYFATLAAIHFDEKRWSDALEAAERGLRLDAEYVPCVNLRAMALVKLGRRAEAGETIEGALSKSPEDSMTHANQGWTLLESGDHRRALEHFREALRLEPQNEWARLGIVEALKSRHLVYALILRYFLWMSKLSTRAQWGVVLAVWFGNRALGGVSRNMPDLAPWILPLRILLVVAILLTWTADPLFNLLLRLNRFGRMALSPHQMIASNWFGACVGLALLSLALCFVFGFGGVFLDAAVVYGFLMVPVAGAFRGQPGWPRRVLLIWAATLALVGTMSLALDGLGDVRGAGDVASIRTLSDTLFMVFLFGTIAFMWGANLIIPMRPRH